MMDIRELRQALEQESANLSIDMPVERVRRRARGLRVRRGWTVAGAGAAIIAIVVPVVLLGSPSPSGSGGQSPVGAGAQPASSPTTCTNYSLVRSMKSGIGDPGLGPLLGTGSGYPIPAGGPDYEVLFGLSGTVAQPVVEIGYRNSTTGDYYGVVGFGLARDADGDLPGKYAGQASEQFFSAQVRLGPHRVVDVGFYTHAAARITVASEGVATDAFMSPNTETGWTLFYVERDTTPIPDLRNEIGGIAFTGPEMVTLTAYDAAGNVQHTVGHSQLIGLPIEIIESISEYEPPVQLSC